MLSLLNLLDLRTAYLSQVNNPGSGIERNRQLFDLWYKCNR